MTSQRKSVHKEIVCVVFGTLLLALGSPADAQQPKKVPTVGYLVLASLATVSPRVEAFRHGLHDLGYVEGKTIVIEYRSADEKLDPLPGLAAELVRLKVNVIVAAEAYKSCQFLDSPGSLWQSW